MNRAAFFDAYERLSAELFGVLQDWCKLDSSLRAHYGESLALLLVRRLELLREARGGGAQAVQETLERIQRVDGVVLAASHAIRETMGFRPEEFTLENASFRHRRQHPAKGS